MKQKYLPLEWNIKIHKLFLKSTKSEIETILLLSLLNESTQFPKYSQCYFYKLPKDMKYEIFKFIATRKNHIIDEDSNSLKRKRIT